MGAKTNAPLSLAAHQQMIVVQMQLASAALQAGMSGQAFSQMMSLGSQQQAAATVTQQAPPPPITRTPQQFGEIIGFRCWHVEQFGNPLVPYLYSVFISHRWEAGIPVKGNYHDKTSFQDRIRLGDYCGVHAFKHLTDAVDYLKNEGSGTGGYYALGEVALFGDVIFCERGYRAEYAMPHRIIDLIPDRVQIDFDRTMSEQKRVDLLRQLNELYCSTPTSPAESN